MHVAKPVLIAITLFFSAGFSHAQIPSFTPSAFVLPANPQSGELISVGVLFPIGGCIREGTFSVKILGNAVAVLHTVQLPAVTEAGTCVLERSIAGLPAGNYQLQWTEAYPAPIPTTTYSINFLVGQAPAPATPIPTLSFLALFTLAVFVGILPLYRRGHGQS